MPFTKRMTEVFLKPGEYFVGNAEHRIRTLLGSCVSITIWCPRARLGAMSHFLLPSRGVKSFDELDGRYGDEALTLMLRQLAAVGVKPVQCHAKIFGGGDMFPGHTKKNDLNVGQRNGYAARSMLVSRGINVVSESLFGEGYRRIAFDVSTGDVWVRQSKIVDASKLRYGVAA